MSDSIKYRYDPETETHEYTILISKSKKDRWFKIDQSMFNVGLGLISSTFDYGMPYSENGNPRDFLKCLNVQQMDAIIAIVNLLTSDY